MAYAVLTPQSLLSVVWPFPVSLATTPGISVDFSSYGYLDVSVPHVPHVGLWIYPTLTGSSPAVFPHSEICGSTLIYSYPQLIAVSHVLLRLLMPRHSPYALLRLNFRRELSLSFAVLFSELLEFRKQIFQDLRSRTCEKTLFFAFSRILNVSTFR